MDKINIFLLLIVLIIIFNLLKDNNDNKEIYKDTYSQIGQDKNVIKYYKGKKGGYFLDIGATNGVDINNTYLLEKKYKLICPFYV